MTGSSNEPARVLFATELWFPPTGFSSPHRLAIVVDAGGRRRLAIVDGDLPLKGALGAIRLDAEGRAHWSMQEPAGKEPRAP